MHLKKVVSLTNSYFLMLCVMGALAILSSTMAKNPVLNPFAVSLGTPTDLMGIIAAASTIPGILVSLQQLLSLTFSAGRKCLYFLHSFLRLHPFFIFL
jgi:hypothetical protein